MTVKNTSSKKNWDGGIHRKFGGLNMTVTWGHSYWLSLSIDPYQFYFIRNADVGCMIIRNAYASPNVSLTDWNVLFPDRYWCHGWGFNNYWNSSEKSRWKQVIRWKIDDFPSQLDLWEHGSVMDDNRIPSPLVWEFENSRCTEEKRYTSVSLV